MDIVDSNEVIEKLINDNEIVLIYFGNKTCGVCRAIKPKIEELLKNYPNIISAQVDIGESLEVGASYNIFTIPAILVFIETKETIREARNFSIQDLEYKISRYYNMVFE